MKISVDIDCTPEEARRFLGLPDLSAVHELYLEKMKRTIEEGMVTPDSVQALLEQLGAYGRGWPFALEAAVRQTRREMTGSDR